MLQNQNLNLHNNPLSQLNSGSHSGNTTSNNQFHNGQNQFIMNSKHGQYGKPIAGFNKGGEYEYDIEIPANLGAQQQTKIDSAGSNSNSVTGHYND